MLSSGTEKPQVRPSGSPGRRQPPVTARSIPSTTRGGTTDSGSDEGKPSEHQGTSGIATTGTPFTHAAPLPLAAQERGPPVLAGPVETPRHLGPGGDGAVRTGPAPHTGVDRLHAALAVAR